MALQPLIADPNDPMQGTLPPQLPKGLGDTLPPQGGGLPSLGALPPLPSSGGLSSGLKPIVQNPRQQQEQALQEKISSFENPAKPQGFWQKLGHALAQNPYSTAYRNTMEHGRVNELAGLQNQDTSERKEFSEEGLQSAQGREANARADALENPVEKSAWETSKDFIGPNGEPVQENKMTGEMRIAPNLPQGIKRYEKDKDLAPKAMEHVPLLGDDGKPTIANFHPDTGQYTDSKGNILANPKPIPPPPNYGQLILPTKTATYIDQASGVPTEFQWNEKSKKYDIPVGQSATGGYGHEASQAGAVERAGGELIQDLQANKKDLGTLGAWVEKYGLNTPIADPKLAGIQAKMASFAALNPAMHGARGLHAMEHFEKLIGGLQQNPDASIAGIQGIIQTAHAINPGVGAPAVGTVEGGYKFKGGDPSKQENWEKQ